MLTNKKIPKIPSPFLRTTHMVWMEISGNSAEDGPGSEVVGWNAAGSTRQQPVVPRFKPDVLIMYCVYPQYQVSPQLGLNISTIDQFQSL